MPAGAGLGVPVNVRSDCDFQTGLDGTADCDASTEAGREEDLGHDCPAGAGLNPGGTCT